MFEIPVALVPFVAFVALVSLAGITTPEVPFVELVAFPGAVSLLVELALPLSAWLFPLSLLLLEPINI